ncbi:MAG: iron complex outermembrane receptor protein [Phenylobacterium sp.]
MTSQWGLVLGLRWINDDKKGKYGQSDNESQVCLNTIANVGANQLPSSFAPFAVAFSCISNIAPIDTPNTPFPRSFDDTFKDEELTYTVKSAYDINEFANTYASFTHGYKAGGFNLDASAAIGGAEPRFNSETTDAWEIGYKAEFWQRRLRANLAAFHQEMNGFQVLEFTGIQFKTFNVPTVLSSGFEAEFLLNATDDLDLSLAMTFLDARYADNCDKGDSQNEPVSRLCGNRLTNAPSFVSVVGFDYLTQLADTHLTFFIHGSLRHENKRRTATQAFDSNGIANANDWQNTNNKTNLRIGLGDSDGDWTVELWGHNIFDKQTQSITFNLPLRTGARATFFEAPRTYGLTLRTEF